MSKRNLFCVWGLQLLREKRTWRFLSFIVLLIFAEFASSYVDITYRIYCRMSECVSSYYGIPTQKYWLLNTEPRILRFQRSDWLTSSLLATHTLFWCGKVTDSKMIQFHFLSIQIFRIIASAFCGCPSNKFSLRIRIATFISECHTMLCYAMLYMLCELTVSASVFVSVDLSQADARVFLKVQSCRASPFVIEP